jgi:hypothetical protein
MHHTKATRGKERVAPPTRLKQFHCNSIEIDAGQLHKLAAMHCTIEEVASFFRCSVATIKRTITKPVYREAWDWGRQQGKMSLRRLQWQHANRPDNSGVHMAIHLSKHWLGQAEKSRGAGCDGKAMTPVTIVVTAVEEEV